ncbi:MAG: hypothetical protein IPO40_11980 [Fibrobacteres bacterium]|nr:hypothetical protein [Fibrobacterota bacterium]
MHANLNLVSMVRRAFSANGHLREARMLRDSDDSVVLLLHSFVMQLFFERDHISVVCHDRLNRGVGYYPLEHLMSHRRDRITFPGNDGVERDMIQRYQDELTAIVRIFEQAGPDILAGDREWLKEYTDFLVPLPADLRPYMEDEVWR